MAIEPLTEDEIALAESSVNEFGILSKEAPKEEPVAEELSEDEILEEVSEEEAEEPAEEIAEETVEETAEETSEPEKEDWITAEIRRQAAAYDIPESSLGMFQSAEEFGRSLSLIDRREAVRDRQVREPEKQEEEAVEEPSFDPEQFKEFDEPIYKMAQVFKEQQEELKALKSAHQESLRQEQIRQQQEEMNRFHDALDARNPDFYGISLKDGRPVNLTEEEGSRRQWILNAAMQEAEAYAAQQQSLGRPVAGLGWDDLIERAEKKLYPSGTPRQEPEPPRTEQIKKQSRRRRPVASNRSVPAADSPDDLANHPEIVKFWNQLVQENG